MIFSIMIGFVWLTNWCIWIWRKSPRIGDCSNRYGRTIIYISRNSKLDGAQTFEKIQLTSFFYAWTNYTESSISSSYDESEASPVTGWEVALFTEQEQSCDQNIVAENIEVGLLFLFLVSGRRDETTV